MLAAMNVNLRAARDLVLPKLISGELNLIGTEREIGHVSDQVAAE